MNRQRLLAFGCWLLALCLTLSINSCSTTKDTSTLRYLSANHITREIEDNSFEYDNLSTRFDVRFDDDNNSIGLKGQLRMQRDSVIWVSLSMKIGIEIARLMITPDSVKFLNRSNKTYMAENLSVLDGKLPMEVSMDFIQNLLVGNYAGTQRGDNSKVSIVDDIYYKLETISRDIVKDVCVMPKTFKISKYKIKELGRDERNIQVEYDDFIEFNGKLMPSSITFRLSSGYDISVEISYSNVTVNGKVEFPFNITNKFDRINIW